MTGVRARLAGLLAGMIVYGACFLPLAVAFVIGVLLP